MKIQNILAIGALVMAASSCNDFLDVKPTGVIDGDLAYSKPDEMVTAAYAALGDCWYDCPFNLWPYGDLSSDDSYKGGWGLGDTGYHPMEIWTTLTSTPGELDALWYRFYCSISRCHRALVALDSKGEEILGEETTKQRKAEVHFLLGHFYFKLVTMFRQVPWITQETFETSNHENVRNDEYSYEELMLKVIEEFKIAYDALEAGAPGASARANKTAAAAYLAKCYLNLAWGDGYESTTGEGHINAQYMNEVLRYTEDVMNSAYGYLEDFGDIFLPEFKNSKESVFAVQTSDYTEDNTTQGRNNWSNTLNGCWGIWSWGWDFHKPSQNLVNAFKTKDGLPMFDNFNDEISYPVRGVASAQKYDPRLFHTVGMPSWPYKYEESISMTMDNSRDPSDYGYYTSLKEVPQRSQGESCHDNTWQHFAMNDYIFRFTDVMLMRAEALVEVGQLAEAQNIINDIRRRAQNSVGKHIGYAADYCEIAQYPAGYFSSKEVARKCVQWERRLELAMENDRFFSLRRWGMASKTLNAFFEKEKNMQYEGKAYGAYLSDAHFTPEKNEFYPVPYNQLYYVPGLYKQNKGYN